MRPPQQIKTHVFTVLLPLLFGFLFPLVVLGLFDFPFVFADFMSINFNFLSFYFFTCLITEFFCFYFCSYSFLSAS